MDGRHNGRPIATGNRPMQRFRICCLLLLLALPPLAGARCVDGTVRALDASGARPLPGVAVSDGRQVAWSGADGRWALKAPLAGPVFVVKPAGHQVPAREDGTPDFWRHRDDGRDCDFILEPQGAAAGSLEVLVFSDPQTSDLREVGYYRDAIVAPLVDRHGAALGVTLGDVTNDDLALYPALNQATT